MNFLKIKGCWPIVIFFLIACGREEKSRLFTFEDTAMTIPYRILIGHPLTSEEQAKIIRIIDTTFNEIDTIYNKWNPSSELSKINQASGAKKIALSDKLYHLLQLTDFYVLQTKGLFDPTIEPIQKIWKEALSNRQVPSVEAIAAAKPYIGWGHIALDKPFIQKTKTAVQLDLGGIAKGYGVDRLVENLALAGFENIYVDWGGEIRVKGHHPEGRYWKVSISDPRDPARALLTLELNNQAVATSGDYLQQWTVNHQTYFHIIHPHKLQPLIATYSSIASATVIASTCVEADVLATTALLFSEIEEAEQWCQQFKENSFWIYSRESLARQKNFCRISFF